ncbi:MAG TPA: hypothetical protein VIK72_05565 [Clostridiaceae bacterium]
MRFTIINIWERIYKKIIVSFVILITIINVGLYLNLTDKSDTFVFSTLYTLLLFIIGIIVNFMEKKIDGKFYDRKDCYFMLKRLKDLFKTIKLKNYSVEDVRDEIIWFKTFSCRYERIKGGQPYIYEQGFKFDYTELDLETKFLEKYDNLFKKLNNCIQDYIKENSISTKVTFTHIDSIYFDVAGWCSKYCNLKDEELNKMEKYIYDQIIGLQFEMKELETLMKKVTRLYSSYRKKVEWNIKKVEKAYGKRIEYEFYKEDKYINEIIKLRADVMKVNDNISSKDEHEELLDNFCEIKENINRLNEKIDSLEDEIISEIDTTKNELIKFYNE